MAVELNVDTTLESLEEKVFELTDDDTLTSQIMDEVRDMIRDLRASGQLIDHLPASSGKPA